MPKKRRQFIAVQFIPDIGKYLPFRFTASHSIFPFLR